MQYLIMGHDGTDGGAEGRRLAARPAHISLGDKMKAEGTMLYGVALLNDKEKMVGSVLVCDFPTREALDAYLKIEPYVVQNVWERFEVRTCKVGPSFSVKK